MVSVNKSSSAVSGSTPRSKSKKVSSPPPTPTPSSDSQVNPILIILLIALIAGLSWFVWTNKELFSFLPFLPKNVSTNMKTSKAAPTMTPRPTPTPTPSYLPPGKQTYNVSQSSSVKGPKVSALSLDPLDVKPKMTQTLVAKITSSTSVLSATLKIYSDNTSRELPLTNSPDGWTTQWVVDDTVWYRYIIKIQSKDNQGTSQVIVSPRTTGPIDINTL